MSFQSYEYIKYLEYNQWGTNKHSWQYKIIDSDGWEELAVAVANEIVSALGVGIGVINAYENRNLPVAKNLIKAFQWCNNKYRYGNIQCVVEWNEKYNPKYSKYADEVEKYFLLT